MKKSKKIKNIILLSIFVIAIVVVASTQLTQSVAGLSNEMEYLSEWRNNDGETGAYVSESILKLPENSQMVSITPDYDFKTAYRLTTDLRINVKYEVYNYDSSSYENIHDKSWYLKNYDRESTKFKTDGETVYTTGKPERIQAVRTDISSYDRYYGCLDGMTVSEALVLNPWAEGTSSYTYKCLYPEVYISTHKYGDDSDENWDIEYFPELINLNSNYIENDEARFRISVSVITGGIDSIDNEDFEVDIQGIQSPKTIVYVLSGDECIEDEKYNFQLSGSDYFTEESCQLGNALVECFEKEDCECEKSISSCNGNECRCGFSEFIGFKLQYLLFLVPLTILTLIVLIIRNIKKK